MPLLLLLLLVLAGASCSPVRAASPEALRSRVESLPRGIRGERVLRPSAISRFYEARRFEPAWTKASRIEQVVQAIRAVERDGLHPDDYHLKAIDALLGQPNDRDAAADLDVLTSDAVAALVDDVRYGRVRPIMLDRRWNVDPREGAPPLEQTVEKIVSSSSAEKAIDEAKPDHFIYRGLVGALARLREIDAAGGWPRVPAGAAIRPGASDPRVARLRARLAVTGEVGASVPADSTRYDQALVEGVELFQRRHRLEPDGIIDATTVEAMNVSAPARAAQVRVNLERSRWVLGGLKDDFLLVNLPAFKTYLIRGGRNVWETRIQIGDEARQTPAFRADLKTVVFNPDWTVPPTILAKDVLEGIRRGEDMIAKKHLTVLDAQGRPVDPGSIDWNNARAEAFPYVLRQPPGPGNALGRVKFLFPNPYSVYLHDTPHRELFESEDRTFSSGCMRVERPLELAELLLKPQGWSAERIQRAIDEGATQNVQLEHPLPILIVYWTVSVGASGEVRYMRDVYERDGPVLAALDRPPPRLTSGTRAGR